MSRSFFVVMLVSTLISSISAAQEKQLSVDREHLVGVIEAHLASLEGWRSGDFLFRSISNGEGKRIVAGETIRGVVQPKVVVGPDAFSVVIREDLLQRVVFDLDKQRALVINRCEIEERVFNGLDEEVGRPIIRLDDRVLLYEFDKHIFVRQKAGEIQKTRNQPTMVQMLTSFGVPDVRYFGVNEGPFGWSDDVRWRLEYFGNAFGLSEFSNTGQDRYRVVLRKQEVKESERQPTDEGQYAIDWDLSCNVPVRFVSHHCSPEACRAAVVADVKWGSHEGNFLPEFARVSHYSHRSYASRNIELSEEKTIDVHWFSFNQELKPELFDVNLLHDRKKLDEMLNTDVFEKSSDLAPKDN
ncbi:MAG: hypothetical protein JNL67_07695 [Planctomycetaceae bacterium]|nr:hypothetical protein [Planctomycetaceae bacterium]